MFAPITPTAKNRGTRILTKQNCRGSQSAIVVQHKRKKARPLYSRGSAPDRKMGGREGLNVDLADTNPCPPGPPV
jgi:hypothetical protein